MRALDGWGYGRCWTKRVQFTTPPEEERVSSRRHLLKMLGALAVLGMLGTVFAGSVSAKMTAHQRSHVRKHLMRLVKHNPRAVLRRGFIKKASLVNFQLPVTIRLTGTTNRATIDLGPSLGTRSIGLGGSLPAELVFHDAFDGGSLGTVDLNLLAGGPGGLTTTSIPLLSNTDVSNATQAAGGCSDFIGSPTAGVDDPALLQDSLAPGNNNVPAPYLPSGINSPVAPGPQDTVFRTGGLTLKIDTTGTTVSAADYGLPAGTIPTTTVGKSGGQANLFGNIPGKSTQVDVTASLVTDINSILRQVDSLDNGPAAGFNCRQAWTGKVTNHLPGIHLNGTLKISPAITSTGKLRIAKTQLSSPSEDPIAVAACLMPEQAYAQETGIPSPPINPAVASAPPTDQCNTVRSPTLQSLGVQQLTGGQSPYTTSADGSQVAVAGGITVNTLNADVLIGQNQ